MKNSKQLMVGIFSAAMLISLSGCGNHRDKEKTVPNDPISRNVAGSFGGQTWSFSAGIAIPTDSGYEVYLAGNGEPLSCEVSSARTNHLAFRIPNQLGTYNWDRANPGSGSSPLFFVFKFQNEFGYGTETIISQTSTINLINISSGLLTGSVRGASSGSGNRAGTVDGNFTAKICSNSRTPENPPLYKMIEQLQGTWWGPGYTKDLSSGRIVNTNIDFDIMFRGSDQSQFRVIDRDTGRTLFDSTLIIRSDYIEQMCIPDGSTVPRTERVGSYNQGDGSISIQILDSNCNYSRTRIRFSQVGRNLSLYGNYERSNYDGSRTRSVIEFGSDSLVHY